MKRLNNWLAAIDRQDAAAGVFFLLNLYLVFNLLMPDLREINPWDESVYANTGRLLAEGRMIPFSRNPLVGVLYAIPFFLLRNSQYWLIESLSLGRVILFSGMWWAGYLVFRRFRQQASPFIMVGLLFVSPVLITILRNPSDALFAVMSGLALWQFLGYLSTRQPKQLVWTSVLVALAAFSRNDGLVLFAVLIALALWQIWKQPNRWSLLAAAVLPFIGLVGGYVISYGLITGDFDQGVMSRSYIAFLQGQAGKYPDEDCVLLDIECGVIGAEEVYGTGEENDYSVLKAIANNPQAYWQHLRATLELLPRLFYLAYGKLNIFVLAVLGARGIYELIRSRQAWLLVVLAGWSAYLAVYFLTFFRRGYLMMVFFLVYSLVGFGIQALSEDAGRFRPRLMWSAGLGLCLLTGILAGVEVVTLSSLLLLAAIWGGALAVSSGGPAGHGRVGPAVMGLLLAAGILLNPGINPPLPRQFGLIAEEAAVPVIQEALLPGSLVAAGPPGWVWNANMTYISLNEPQFNVTNSDELYEVMVENEVDAIYVDHHLTNSADRLWAMIEPDIGTRYEEIFSGREGSIRVLLVQP